MSEQHPELRWAPIPPKPKNRGRVWIIVLLIVGAVATVAAVLFFLLPRVTDPLVEPSPRPNPSASATRSASPLPTDTSAPTSPESSETSAPVQTAPPVVGPDLDGFAARVQPRLDDGVRGLDMLTELSGQDAVGVVDQLQQDAQRLAETTTPSSIADAWFSSLAEYSAALTELRLAADGGESTTGAVSTVRERLQALRDLAGI